MAHLIYLKPGVELPQFDDEQPWLIVEGSDDGRFFGTGAAWKPNGDAVFYGSLAENDLSLATAVSAALEWATKYDVPTVWVQTTP
jgi:hypothetical protein